MLTKKEAQEYAVLDALGASPHPVGSVALSFLLREKDVDASAATIGRLLSALDHGRYTLKRGNKGRVLTDSGKTRLRELKGKQALAAFSSRFHHSIDPENKDNLVDVLIARRGIEREIARLAARNATDGDLRRLRDIQAAQAEVVRSGELSSELDVDFHQTIALASRNDVLAAAYDFIWQHGRFSPVMDYIRRAVGGVLSVDHERIIDALVARDSLAAEARMMEHLDSLIDDVHEYWTLVCGDLEDQSGVTAR